MNFLGQIPDTVCVRFRSYDWDIQQTECQHEIGLIFLQRSDASVILSASIPGSWTTMLLMPRNCSNMRSPVMAKTLGNMEFVVLVQSIEDHEIESGFHDCGKVSSCKYYEVAPLFFWLLIKRTLDTVLLPLVLQKKCSRLLLTDALTHDSRRCHLIRKLQTLQLLHH